jgi:dipeptidyl aminopeptidase/acylaminoacyl peptidase
MYNDQPLLEGLSMNIGLRKLSLFLFVIFLIGNLPLSVAQGKNAPLYFQQNLSVLEDRNGEIVEQKQVRVASKFKDKIDCYKIRYLSDGLEIVGFIFKPKNSTSKLPVLIFNRGGNREYGKLSGKWLKYLSFLASNNYVVLASQYRGNDGGQGREQFGGTDINDVLDLIPLAKSLQFTDPNNIFMLGFSRGGLMTYLAIKYGAPINAAAVVGGITDLWRWYGERSGVRIILGQLVGLDKKDYDKRSAVHWPEKINIPILILHGVRDDKVNVNQAKELSKKLDELGKEHELFVFPKGNHSIGNYKPERNEKIFEWFEKYKK